MAFERKTPILFHGWRILVLVALSLNISIVYAETYRWKDKDGNVHYGAVVPAEYAKQPYDILDNNGLLIERVEDTTISRDQLEEQKELEEKKKGRQPLISEEERRIQADRLLLVQYRSEEEIAKALELEIAQLGYDNRIINQSFESTTKAIRDNIKNAADQQRANLPVSEEQEKEISHLYARRAQDNQRREAMKLKEQKIRERYQRDLERYRFLTSDQQEEQGENG